MIMRAKPRRPNGHSLAIGDRFWTPRQIGERWLVSPRTVRRLIEAGELGACRLGKQIRIRHTDLLAYEHGQKITPERPV